MRRLPAAFLFCAFLGLCESAQAHFHMLLPSAASVRRGADVTIVYQWGHPFEHQLFDASPVVQLGVLAPDGQKSDLREKLEKTPVPAGEQKTVAAYRFPLTPDQRGDYILLMRLAPVWMEEERHYFRDTVKVILHVQAQRGWDRLAATSVVPESEPFFEMVPLTRPYGLQAGMTFQAQVRSRPASGPREGNPVPGSLVEIERYNPLPPAELPADEQITRTAKTDPNGVVTCTLTEPGWWCLTARQDDGKLEHDGKPYPVLGRTTLWIFVDDRNQAGPSK